MPPTSTSARLKEVPDRNLIKFNRDKSKVLHLKEEPQVKIVWRSDRQKAEHDPATCAVSKGKRYPGLY